MYLLYKGSMANKPETYATYQNAYDAGAKWAEDEFHDAPIWIEKVE